MSPALLGSALPGSALLFVLAFGCGSASSWIDSSPRSMSICTKASMDAMKKAWARRLVGLVKAFLATVAEMALGLATSG